VSNDVKLGRDLARALAWAAKRDTSVPELLAVAAVVLADGGSRQQAVAAVVCGAVDRGRVRPKRIRRRFGGKVARIVVACCDQSKQRAKGPGGRAENRAEAWRRRRERRLAGWRDPATGTAPLRIGAAVELCEVRALVATLRRVGPEAWLHRDAAAVDELWYRRSAALVLGARRPGPLTLELRATVRQLEEIAGWWFDVGDPQPGGAA